MNPTVLADAARDALSVALEHVPNIGLEHVRAEHRRHERTLSAAPQGDDLRAAVNAVKQRVVQLLRERDPGVTEDEATAAITAALADSPAPTFEVLDVCKPGAIPAAEFLIPGRTYKRTFHQYVGREGTNKSMLVIFDLATLASQGEHVTLIEYEMDEDAIARMLDDMGFDREALREHFHAVCPAAPFDAGLLAEVLAAFPAPVVVALDNAAEAVASTGGDENVAKDALAALKPLRDLSHRANGPATIVVDHLPWSRENAARGSTAKAGILEVIFQVESVPPVTRERAGRIKLTCRKDRPSYIGKNVEIWLSVGDGEGGLPITLTEAPGVIAGELTDEMAKMIVALERHASDNPLRPELPAEKVLEAAGLSRSRRRKDVLAEMAANPSHPRAMRVQTRGEASSTTLYRYQAASEADDDAAVLGF